MSESERTHKLAKCRFDRFNLNFLKIISEIGELAGLVDFWISCSRYYSEVRYWNWEAELYSW